MDPSDAMKRSIDSLQRLYAVIGALAIGEALRSTVFKDNSNHLQWSDLNVPLCIATLVTVIPFIHGMNRHLDEHIDDLEQTKSRGRIRAMLILDFLVFVIECCALFILGLAVGAKRPAFSNVLLVLLIIDMGWAVLRTFGELEEVAWTRIDEQTKTHIRKQLLWAGINVVAIVALVIVQQIPSSDQVNAWLIAVIAIGRSGADYWYGKEMYFPGPLKNSLKEVRAD